MTFGFERAGIPVLAGYDLDPSCEYPYAKNNRDSRFHRADVARLNGGEVARQFAGAKTRVLIGCAPCQPFSKLAVREGRDERDSLLLAFLRVAKEVRPDFLCMENVPNLLQKNRRILDRFESGLRNMGYGVRTQIVECLDYGVPQTRKRLVLLAGADGKLVDLRRPASPRRTPTVRKAIGALPAILAGNRPAGRADPLHVSPALSPANMARIRATPEGGGWRDWPEELRLSCHLKDTGRYYGSVYGRMSWDNPAPTMTTQCFGYGNGRFGHPEQDRAISLREAAMLQTFPRNYSFVEPRKKFSYVQVGRHIGNAVPPRLATHIAKAILAAS